MPNARPMKLTSLVAGVARKRQRGLPPCGKPSNGPSNRTHCWRGASACGDASGHVGEEIHVAKLHQPEPIPETGKDSVLALTETDGQGFVLKSETTDGLLQSFSKLKAAVSPARLGQFQSNGLDVFIRIKQIKRIYPANRRDAGNTRKRQKHHLALPYVELELNRGCANTILRAYIHQL